MLTTQTESIAHTSTAIAIVIGQLGQGGSERQLYMFLAQCDQRRWSPTVYVSGALGHWEAPISALGVPVVLLRGSPIAKLLQFRSACIAQNVKCVFSWSSYTNVFGLALLGRDARCLGSFRNALFSDLPKPFRWVWSRAALSAISIAVCNSRETCEYISTRMPPRRTAVYVPNVVDPLPFAQQQAFRTHWRAQLGLDPNDLLVVGVGRLVPQKNFARFISVIAQVRQHIPIKGVVAGADLGCLSDLKRRAAYLGLQTDVRFIGTVPDARELLCAADIFLLTSDYEGMPNVVLEAMSAGAPCVVTKVNAVSDLIEHGTTGFIAEHSVEQLALHVARLARDPPLRHAVGARARDAIRHRHDPVRIGRRLWSLCEGALERHQ